MQKLAERLTEYILKQGIIEEEDFDIYKYGFKTGMESISKNDCQRNDGSY